MKKFIKVVVLCLNSEGAAEFFTHTARVTDDEYRLGQHYDQAAEAATEAGFEPKLSFDQNDPAAKQLGSVHLFM